MTDIAYPRRSDAVRFEFFDGSLESAQKIANMCQESVYMYLAPNMHFYDGDKVALSRIEVASRSVSHGAFVVVPTQDFKYKNQVEVLDYEQFAGKYSKDGH